MKNLPEHIYNSLGNLNTDRNSNLWNEKTKGRAPHKVFLLLSILDGIEQGWISDSIIYPSQNLVDNFFQYWDNIMGEDRSTSIALPYFYMKSESFWELVYKPGKNKFTNSPSWGALKDRVEFARINEDLFEAMNNRSMRQMIRGFLMETYFDDITAVKVGQIGASNKRIYLQSENLRLIAAEPFIVDHSEMLKFRQVTKTIQERDRAFSNLVRNNFGHFCAVCRNRVITPEGKSLVDAAHIIPWSKYNNDDPRNGLSLCKSHHWMFDNFMITVKDDYTLQLSKHLKAFPNVITGANVKKGEKLYLPTNSDFLPSIDALKMHQQLFEETHRSWKL